MLIHNFDFEREYLMMDKRDDKSAQEIQAELNEIEHDITLRKILWQSHDEWTKLVEEWTATNFDSLNVQVRIIIFFIDYLLLEKKLLSKSKENQDLKL